MIKDEDIIDTTTSKGVVEFFETYWDTINETVNTGRYYLNKNGSENYNEVGDVYLHRKSDGRIAFNKEGEHSLTLGYLSGNEYINKIPMTCVNWYSVFNIKK